MSKFGQNWPVPWVAAYSPFSLIDFEPSDSQLRPKLDSPSPHSAQFDFFALQPLLEGLSHLHEWLAISNREGRTLWTSDGQLANDVLAGKTPGPELIEVLPISKSQRQRPQLRKRLKQIHQELGAGRGPAGEVIDLGDGVLPPIWQVNSILSHS